MVEVEREDIEVASSNFDNEIKGAMAKPSKPLAKRSKFPPDTKAEAKAEGDTPAEMARDKARGIVEGSPRDERLDAQQMHGGIAPHQVAAATSIAHAILGHKGVG